MEKNIHALISYIRSKVPLNQETIEAISNNCQIKQFEKGHLLIQQDKITHNLYFIDKGAARAFYYHDGKDITSWIYQEYHFITSWSSFYQQTPASENAELLEDSRLIVLPFHKLQKLYDNYPRMERFGRLLAEDQLAFLDNFYRGFMFISAKEKYDYLKSIFPDVDQRVNLGHIASFLGISQETLSRIRRKK